MKGSYRLDVAGYSPAKGRAVGKFLASEIFSAGGRRWAIYFFLPGRHRPRGQWWLRVPLRRPGQRGARLSSALRAARYDQSERQRTVHGGQHFQSKGPLRTRPPREKGLEATLEISAFLHDDSLVFECTISVVKTRTETPRQWSIPAPPSCVLAWFSRSLASLSKPTS